MSDERYPPAQPYQGGPGYPGPPPPMPVPFPPAAAGAGAIRIDPVQGTSFGVAYPAIPAMSSGRSIGAMIAGIGSILVAFVVTCFGLIGAADGWGPAVAGAFTALATFLALGGIGLGVFGVRQIRRAGGRVIGRGMAIAGIVCGATGFALAVLALVLSFVATAGAN